MLDSPFVGLPHSSHKLDAVDITVRPIMSFHRGVKVLIASNWLVAPMFLSQHLPQHFLGNFHSFTMLTKYINLIFHVSSAFAYAGFNGKRQTATGFNAAQQHIDVSGAHAFITPKASDLRGPCPALNALANHGYIARNGYTTLQESASAITSVLGIGKLSLRSSPPTT